MDGGGGNGASWDRWSATGLLLVLGITCPHIAREPALPRALSGPPGTFAGDEAAPVRWAGPLQGSVGSGGDEPLADPGGVLVAGVGVEPVAVRLDW